MADCCPAAGMTTMSIGGTVNDGGVRLRTVTVVAAELATPRSSTTVNVTGVVLPTGNGPAG